MRDKCLSEYQLRSQLLGQHTNGSIDSSYWLEISFFWAGRYTDKEVDGKRFIISGEDKRNISKHGCYFYAEFFLLGFVKGEWFCSIRVTKESGTRSF